MAIIVYNRKDEDYSNKENNYPIFRGGSILGNPYTEKPLKGTLAIYKVRNRDEAIDRYDTYFDLKYNSDEEFKLLIDDMYEKYKRGEDIYLECYCHPMSCHGDVIKRKIESRLLKEKILKARSQMNN